MPWLAAGSDVDIAFIRLWRNFTGGTFEYATSLARSVLKHTHAVSAA